MTEYLQGVSVRLAAAMDRRRFIRRAATGAFAGAAALAAGRVISPTKAFGYISSCETPTGYGCPKCCGSSKCCAAQTGGCVCSNGQGGCKNGTANCHGNYNDWGSGQNCWAYTYDKCQGYCYYRVYQTCCDCYTTGCSSDPKDHCIAYLTTYTVIGSCGGGHCPGAAGSVAGVATGDPATSWGIQPELEGLS